MARDQCPTCHRRFAVKTTRTDGEFRTRYCVCRSCGTRATKPEIVPLSLAPVQRGPGQSASLYPR